MANRRLSREEFAPIEALYANQAQMVSSYPNTSKRTTSLLPSPNYKPHPVIMSQPPTTDHNRYNYFDNLSAVGHSGDSAREAATPSDCMYCGATEVLVKSARNTSMSFNRNREEHSSSLTPHESPLNHAVRSAKS